MKLSQRFLRLAGCYLYLVLVNPSFGQIVLPDSCSDLVFHSALEKKAFTAFCNKDVSDYLTLSLAIDPSSDENTLQQVRNTLNNAATQIRLGMEKQKKAPKKLRFVFDYVQQTFLKTYDLDAGFSGMFRTGNYNCLTATILYALLLDELEITYTVKFLPGHVYLIAFAHDIPYMFETTDPVSGFFEMNNEVKSRAVQGLRLMNFVAADNINTKNQYDIFDRYYIQLNNTDLRGLAGYEYVNTAVNEMIRQNAQLAFHLIEKACVLTPMSELTFLKEQMLIHAIGKCGKNTQKRAGFLVKYYQYSSNPDKKNQVADEFKNSVYQCLFSSFPTPDSLEPIYRTLYSGISDESFKTVITDTYCSMYSNYLRLEERPEVLHRFILDAYSNGNRSSFLKAQVQDYIGFLFQFLQQNDEGLRQLDSISLQYTFLKEFSEYQSISCYLMLTAAEEAFRMRNFPTAERYLRLFEERYPDPKEAGQHCNPSSVYSLAGSYYFRQGNTAKAKTTLKKGLSYEPDNWELRKKLSELSK